MQNTEAEETQSALQQQVSEAPATPHTMQKAHSIEPPEDAADAVELSQLRRRVRALEEQNARLQATMEAQAKSQAAVKSVEGRRGRTAVTEQGAPRQMSSFGRGGVTFKSGFSSTSQSKTLQARDRPDSSGTLRGAASSKGASTTTQEGGSLQRGSGDVQGDREATDASGNYAAREQVVSLERKLAALRRKLTEKNEEVAAAQAKLEAHGQRCERALLGCYALVQSPA